MQYKTRITLIFFEYGGVRLPHIQTISQHLHLHFCEACIISGHEGGISVNDYDSAPASLPQQLLNKLNIAQVRQPPYYPHIAS
jgi:hypothetical protein